MYETETSHSFEYWKGIAREVNNAMYTDRYTPYNCAYIFDDLKKGGNVYNIALGYNTSVHMVRLVATLCGLRLSRYQLSRVG